MPYRPKIVLAEDNADLRDLLILSLECEGYHVKGVADGEELLEELKETYIGKESPAIVISDYSMPYMTGLQVCERVRDWGWKVPFILITAYLDREIQVQADASSVIFLEKPFDLRDLLSLVQKQVQGGKPLGEPGDGPGVSDTYEVPPSSASNVTC